MKIEAIPDSDAARRGDDGIGANARSAVATPHRARVGNAAAIAILLALVLGLYWQTTLSMAAIWQRSETFAHGYVVFPIFLYLLWRQREVLEAIAPTPCYPALLGVAASGIVWLCGELVNAVSVSQFAMIAMFQFAVWSTFGTRVARAIGIPLAFLFFAVPFGEFLIPTLMDWTADFAAAAIRASGVPIYREGNYFTLPTGRWSVVEACSGIRYLIASFMVGTLYAYLSYRSSIRRLAFIVASLVVPIVANWVRAYMIVMLGHLTDNRLAAGADHLIYGWVFFGVVMAFLFWVGSKWREDDRPHPAAAAAPAVPDSESHSVRRIGAAGLAALVLIAIWLPLDAWLGRGDTVGGVQLNDVVAMNGWTSAPAAAAAFRPDVSRFRAEVRQAFRKGDVQVGLDIAFYRHQSLDTKAITSTNQLVATSNPHWRRVSDGKVTIAIGGEAFRPRAVVLAGETDRLLVWQWFWVDGHVTSSEYAAKIYQLLAIARGHGDPVAWVVAYSSTARGIEAANAALQTFVVDMQTPIDEALQKAATE